MPKYGIHHIVLQRAIDERLLTSNKPSSQSAGATLTSQHDAAMLGAVGPDLFFFAPDYPTMEKITQLYLNFKPILDALDTISDGARKIKEAVVEPVDKQVKDAVGEENVVIVQLMLQEMKEIASYLWSLLKTKALAGVVDGVNGIPDATGVNRIQKFFIDEFTPPMQHNEKVAKWFWFDMLHYGGTGRFARNLVDNAMTPRQRAYALGYLSHIATDMTGHAYVNQIVGAPYRRNVQRHVTAENFMDTWAFDHYFGESLNESLLKRMSLNEQTCTDDITQLLMTAFQQTFPTAPGVGKAYFSADQIHDTYTTFHGILELMSRMGVARPEAPFPTVLEILDKAWQDIFQPPPAPPATPDSNCTWQDMLGMTSNSGACWSSLFENVATWLDYLRSLAEWLHNRIKEVFDFLLTCLLSLPVTVLLALIYAIQLMIYEQYRLTHWSLAIQGLLFPLRDELNNSVTARLVRADLSCVPQLATGLPFASTITRYPMVTQAGDSHLLCPIRGSESDNRIWNFLRLDVPPDPRQFIEGVPFSEENLRKYAAAATPDAAFAVQREGRAIGNAIDLTAWMIATANDPAASKDDRDVCFTNWNLDGDRGYGYKVWVGNIVEAGVVNGQMQQARVEKEKLEEPAFA